MPDSVLYVYAIAAEAVTPRGDAVDDSQHFASIEASGLHAIYTSVAAEEFSQESIDRRSGDLEWLGAIGYRHQAVMADLMKATAIVPLRAFSLFSSEQSLRAFVLENASMLRHVLERVEGKQEWTLRVEFDPQRWSEALVGRVESLRAISSQIDEAPAGKAFLLRKKLDEEKKRASRDAEQAVVREIEQAVLERLACETVAESRIDRDGAFPQINVLLNRDEESRLQELHDELSARYAADGVTLAITGPWSPYSFAGRMKDEG